MGVRGVMIIREINQPTASAPSFVDFPVDFSLWIPTILVDKFRFELRRGFVCFRRNFREIYL